MYKNWQIIDQKDPFDSKFLKTVFQKNTCKILYDHSRSYILIWGQERSNFALYKSSKIRPKNNTLDADFNKNSLSRSVKVTKGQKYWKFIGWLS